MNKKTMISLFKKYDAVRFEDFPYDSYTNRPDLAAFILLDRLAPGTTDLLSAAEHDQVFIDIDLTVFLSKATNDDIKALSACGVWYDDDLDCFSLWV